MSGYRGRYDYHEAIYGEISVKDNTTPTPVESGGITQITVFDTNGHSNGMDSDHTHSHIHILRAGIYDVTFSIHLNNNAAQTHTVDVSVYANNSTKSFVNLHGHRTLTGGLGDVGSMSCSGKIEVEGGETIELWATTDSEISRSITFEDVTLTITKVSY